MSVQFQQEGKDVPLASWKLNAFGALRIVFGVIWGIDAWFKWQPDFINTFATYLMGAQEDQPTWVHHWIGFWLNVVHVDPTVFAYMVAVGETAIAIALLLGVFTNVTVVAGSLLSLMIWSTAEGFGGPYTSGATDVGSAVIYPLVFVGLFLVSAGMYLGFDRKLTAALGPLGFLASGRIRSRASGPTFAARLASN